MGIRSTAAPRFGTIVPSLFDYVGNCGGLPSEDLLEMVFTSKWGPKWSPNGSQMAPQRPLGASWPAEGLLERSWRAPGELLERSWAVLGPKKVIGNGSWTAQGLRGDWFQHGLGVKCPPKVGPRGVPKSGPESGPGSKRQNLDF